MKVYWLAALALVACTRRNPAVCCLDEADCKAADIDGVRECTDGLACVDHECVVPSCTMMGCTALAPVCDIKTDVCEGCSETSQCSAFGEADVCDTAGGACVECLESSDCPSAKPVCENTVCRPCKLDLECSSGACGDDGACVAESSVVYLAPAGTDAGACTSGAPCQKVSFGLSRTTSTRNHIVMAQGGYTELVSVTPQSTPASRIFLHGGGSFLSQPAGSVEKTTLRVGVPATVRHLDVRGQAGAQAVTIEIPSTILEHVIIRGATGLGLGLYTSATLRDLYIEDASTAVSAGSVQLEADGLTIVRGGYGVYVRDSSVQLTNVVIYKTGQLAMDLTGTTGVVSFATIADAGNDSGTGPRAVVCSSGLTFQSSILWVSDQGGRGAIAGCTLASTIVGPLPIEGAMNINPAFIGNGDYHLAPGSPARDAVDTGPPTDVEGASRPRGARFDLGAYEAAP